MSSGTLALAAQRYEALALCVAIRRRIRLGPPAFLSLRGPCIVEQDVITRVTRCPTPVDGGHPARHARTAGMPARHAHGHATAHTPLPTASAAPVAPGEPYRCSTRPSAPLAKNSLAALATCQHRPQGGRRSSRTPTSDDGSCGPVTGEEYSGSDTCLLDLLRHGRATLRGSPDLQTEPATLLERHGFTLQEEQRATKTNSRPGRSGAPRIDSTGR